MKMTKQKLSCIELFLPQLYVLKRLQKGLNQTLAYRAELALWG